MRLFLYIECLIGSIIPLHTHVTNDIHTDVLFRFSLSLLLHVFIKAKAWRIILVIEEYNVVKYCSKTERNCNKMIVISILIQIAFVLSSHKNESINNNKCRYIWVLPYDIQLPWALF